MSEFKPYLELEFSGKAREKLGYIGEPTDLTDSDGKPLFIGDKVLIKAKNEGIDYGENIIIRNKRGDTGAWGFLDNFKETILNKPAKWSITKSQNFDQLTDSEIITLTLPTYVEKLPFVFRFFLTEAYKKVQHCKIVVRLTPKQVDLSSVWGKSDGQ